MPRAAALVALVLLPVALAPTLVAAPPGPHAPSVAEGYAVAPFASVAAPTSIAFGPGDDGPDLYATTLAGSVVRVAIDWSGPAPVATGSSTFASGFSLPLGLAFDGGALFVADSHAGDESGRTDGRITRVEGESRTVVVDGLPNGRHNANNLRVGPDGRLYVANGNPNDNGVDGGDADVFPYSGAILSFNADAVSASPVALRWRDDAGRPIPPEEVASAPENAAFAAAVEVLAYGFRNVYDVAFGPTGAAYTATNGADAPSSQDALYAIEPGTDYGFPFCYNEGTPGAVARDGGIEVVANPVYGDDARCAGVPGADALLGWHVCATGLDVAPAGSAFGSALFVAECGPFFPEADKEAQSPTTVQHDTGHKVARVALGPDGRATAVEDFLVGLALPTDVLFGPDDALYVADAGAIHRVVALPLPVVPAAAATPVLAGPGAFLTGYASPVALSLQGQSVQFASADSVVPHNVVSDGAGPDGRPLFRSATTGLGTFVVPVLGTEALPPGDYPFRCAIHPESMTGRLTVLPLP